MDPLPLADSVTPPIPPEQSYYYYPTQPNYTEQPQYYQFPDGTFKCDWSYYYPPTQGCPYEMPCGNLPCRMLGYCPAEPKLKVSCEKEDKKDDGEDTSAVPEVSQ
jgi:hypothetical protein